MAEADYSALTAACDRLLRAPGATPERVGISWLHVLSEHPNNLAQYEHVFDRARPASRSAKRPGGFSGFAKKALKRLMMRGTGPAGLRRQLPPKADILFVSHLLTAAHADPDGTDFYYGNLGAQLGAEGVSSTTLLLNHTSVPVRGATKKLANGSYLSRVVLPLRLSASEELRLVRRARSAASVLSSDAESAADAFERAVALQAARHSVTGTTITALRLYRVIEQICAQLKPRVVVVTWEGHAWERLAFHAARSVDASVRCVGYQHTIMFPRAHALRRSLGPQYDPDALLTVGDINRDILKGSADLGGIPVVTYGSHRRAAAPLPRAPDASRRCLVIPEGLEVECLTLFDFVLAAAAALPGVQFLLRMHPGLPFSTLARRHPRFRALPDNVRVSTESDIATDFARCDWALYRGSSAAVHAVLAGVRPIYLEREGELRIDPLFAMKGWRRCIRDVSALTAIVDADRAAGAGARGREWAAAREFCDRYVVAPRPEVVRSLLARAPDLAA